MLWKQDGITIVAKHWTWKQGFSCLKTEKSCHLQDNLWLLKVLYDWYDCRVLIFGWNRISLLKHCTVPALSCLFLRACGIDPINNEKNSAKSNSASTATCQLISLHIFCYATSFLLKHIHTFYSWVLKSVYKIQRGISQVFLPWYNVPCSAMFIINWSLGDLSPFDFLISIQTSNYHMFRFFTMDNVGQKLWEFHSFSWYLQNEVIFTGI